MALMELLPSTSSYKLIKIYLLIDHSLLKFKSVMYKIIYDTCAILITSIVEYSWKQFQTDDSVDDDHEQHQKCYVE